jgi:hypothetical protein
MERARFLQRLDYGDAVGDYLLGMGTMFSSNSLQQDSRQNSFSAYAQDDIKLTAG